MRRGSSAALGADGIRMHIFMDRAHGSFDRALQQQQQQHTAKLDRSQATENDSLSALPLDWEGERSRRGETERSGDAGRPMDGRDSPREFKIDTAQRSEAEDAFLKIARSPRAACLSLNSEARVASPAAAADDDLEIWRGARASKAAMPRAMRSRNHGWGTKLVWPCLIKTRRHAQPKLEEHQSSTLPSSIAVRVKCSIPSAAFALSIAPSTSYGRRSRSNRDDHRTKSPHPAERRNKRHPSGTALGSPPAEAKLPCDSIFALDPHAPMLPSSACAHRRRMALGHCRPSFVVTIASHRLAKGGRPAKASMSAHSLAVPTSYTVHTAAPSDLGGSPNGLAPTPEQHRASTRLVSLSLLCLAVPLVCDPGMSSQLDIQIVGSWVRHPRLCRSIGPTDNALFALMASVTLSAAQLRSRSVTLTPANKAHPLTTPSSPVTPSHPLAASPCPFVLLVAAPSYHLATTISVRHIDQTSTNPIHSRRPSLFLTIRSAHHPLASDWSATLEL
ncbi:uncharacterized protein PAN0_009c3844 [Moesziomyces antarcticus]|uniref:Uncharacterized protein n=1 Tax=Pseudozyma antarctica TaxID=84753 RepID=A0A081CG30_PSEA2|nr:uncharacterized protein PAN0_009c3844 [Moesziomyces antarcticus]GAK65626.1 hypothetical protein PAN0_009c3844 [Moesziomyces antarcticus]